jgi:hypothetical protein
MGKLEIYTKFWTGNFKLRGHVGNLGIIGKRISKLFFVVWDVKIGVGFIWLRMNKIRIFFGQLSNSQLFKRDPARC